VAALAVVNSASAQTHRMLDMDPPVEDPKLVCVLTTTIRHQGNLTGNVARWPALSRERVQQYV